MHTFANALLVHADDNVVVALSPVVVAGTTVVYEGSSLVAQQAVATGHKIARAAIARGQFVVKYGQPIGIATDDIAVGNFVHTHNVATTLHANDVYTFADNDSARIADNSLQSVAGSPLVTRSSVRTDQDWKQWVSGPSQTTNGSAQTANSLQQIASGRTMNASGWASHDSSLSARGQSLTNRDHSLPNRTLSGQTTNADRMNSRVNLAGHTFMGYIRANGGVGIRNEVWILCTVGCINRLAERVAADAHQIFGPHGQNIVDGVYAFTHPYGCAQIGDDLLQTRRAIASLAGHPNCGAVLLMGLGCENNIIQEQVAGLRASEPDRLRVFSAQDVENEVEFALEEVRALANACANDQRTRVPASKLLLGMKCGGSDGFSGLTANPLLGILADAHAAAGGTSVLTEVPEMFGAEKLLMARSASREVFEKQVALINNFKDYFRRYREPISENPAPGNKAGGITTLEEKSLGCIQKGGANCPVVGVLDYGEAYADTHTGDAGGILLANGPGNDAVSCTTLAMSGAQMVLFTTGRGTPFGTCVPTVKIATNSALAAKKPHWIDHNAGDLLETGDKTASAEELWAKILAVASGEEQTCNEKNGYREIAIWKDGVTT